MKRSLLFPAYRSLEKSFKKRGRRALAIIACSAVLVALLLYFGLYKFLVYVGKAPLLGAVFGPIFGRMLIEKLLEMIYVALFFMTVFSSIIASFSTFYLDEEILLLISSPARITRIFWSRFTLMFIESSWMVTAFFAPIFLAFATALNAPIWAYLIYPVYLIAFIILPNITGSLISIILAYWFPIRQMRKIFQFLSGIVLAAMVVFFRFLQPEKLLNPSYFKDISNYIMNLQNPPFLAHSPTSWIHSSSLMLFDGRLGAALNQFAPVMGVLLFGLLILHLTSKYLYLSSWQKSMEAVENQVRSLEWLRRFLILPFRYASRDFKAIAEKEVTVFIRDPAIFSQIFMMAAIVFVYAYNLAILPIKDIPALYAGEINDTLVYFNGPFIGFVLAAVAMRFVYPSISIEGRAFWAVKASPVPIARILKVKFILYFFPLLLLGMILCFISNSVFRVTYVELFWLSFVNVFLMTAVITSLAIGLGALYAQFNTDNPLKISGSFGGFMFMAMSALFVINLLACQAYPLFRLYLIKFFPLAQTKGYVMIVFSFILLLICSALWMIIPLKKGKESIERFEPE